VYVVVYYTLKKKKNNIKEDKAALHKYAFIIAARNENAVIGNLIDSIKNQNSLRLARPPKLR
jgi:cellulose synthase/poly-beta-1,6-N-acetylglucosamine synthase-like glycosyltransferase